MFILFLVNSTSDWRGPTSGEGDYMESHQRIGGGADQGGVVSEEEEFKLGEDDEASDYVGESAEGKTDQGGGLGEEGDYKSSDYDDNFYNYVEGGDSVDYDDDNDSPIDTDDGDGTSVEGEGISEEGDYGEIVDHGEEYYPGGDYSFGEDYGLGEDLQEDYGEVEDIHAGDDQESGVGNAGGKRGKQSKHSP